MANKLVKLEAELNDIQLAQNKSEPIIDKDSSVKKGDQTDPTEEKQMKTAKVC